MTFFYKNVQTRFYELCYGPFNRLRDVTIHHSRNLCLGYLFERLRDYEHVPRPATRARNRATFQEETRHKLVLLLIGTVLAKRTLS